MLTRTLFALTLGLSLSAAAAPADDVTTMLKALSDAFNKGDAKAVAAHFTEDADLINMTGTRAEGKANIEKAVSSDMMTALKGATTHKITAENTRELAPNVWFVDATHEAQNMMMPDGKIGTGKVHVSFVMTKKDGKMQIVAARPYLFVPPPQPARPTGK